MNYISYQSDHILLFKPTSPQATLLFKYSPFSIIQQPNAGNQSQSNRSIDNNFVALLGVKMLKDVPFMIVASEADPFCSIGPHTINEIKKIEWIPIVPQDKIQQVLYSCQAQFESISKLFDAGHHYFSDSYQLHRSYHLNVGIEQNLSQREYADRFIWNKRIMTADGVFPNLGKWCKTIIQGYVHDFYSYLPDKSKISYYVISRRSNKKAGTRYYARGIDDKGNVANFTQTEQIIILEKYTISHLQIRGSVPAFFEQLGVSGLNGELRINRSAAMTKKAFELHFQKLSDIYHRIFCVNLLSIKKSEQQKLTIFFQQLVESYAPKTVKYQYFDFHDQCKNNKFENSQLLVTKIHEIIDCFGYYLIRNDNNQILQRQNGVIRTNCLDCLDRTNYVQSRIALYLLQNVIQKHGNPQIRNILMRQQTFVNQYEKSSDVLKKFNETWAENGDSISLHYTGIGSTHTDITKTGKRTFTGTVNHKMRSLMRFFTQFSDTRKHEAIHQLVNSPDFKTSSVTLHGPEPQSLLVAAISYKIVPNHNYKSGEISFSQIYVERKKPAIVVISGYFQSNWWLKELFKNSKRHELLKNFVQEKTYDIRKQGYQTICSINNENSCLLIFGNQMVIYNVADIKHQSMEKFNKDTLLVCKFNIYRSSMVFSTANCSNFYNFKNLVQKSHSQAFQKNKLGQARSASILSQNYRTILGNIGCQNKLGEKQLDNFESQIQQMQTKQDSKGVMRLVRELLDNDELEIQRNNSSSFMRNYMEGPLKFPPKENRIIFWNQDNMIIRVLQYSQNVKKSCVYGLYGYEIGDKKYEYQ